MHYDFDRIYDRASTDRLKWKKGLFGAEDILPLWVADRDFPVAEHSITGDISILGIVAMEAAFRYCDEWLDCRELGLSVGSLEQFFLERAKVDSRGGAAAD